MPDLLHAQHWRRWVAPLALASLAASLAHANVAQEAGVPTALGASTPAVMLRERDLGDARAALARAELGVSASLDVTPALELKGAFDRPKVATELDPSLSARLRAGYRFDAVGILAARVDLARVEANLRAERRQAVLDALRAQVAELRAGYALAVAQAALEAGERALAEARAAQDATDLTEGQLRDLTLDARLARTALERAERDLEEAGATRAGLGVARLAGVPTERFLLPDAVLADVPRVRLAELQLQRARELSQRNGLFGVVDNLQLIGGYAGSDAATYASVSLDQGRPGANLDLRYRADDTDQWVVGLRATLHLDDGTIRSFTRAARDVADGEAAVGQAREVARARIDAALQRAVQASEDLDAAAAAVDNSDVRIAELRAAAEATRASGAADREIERSETALTRRQTTLATQQDRWARAWDGYVVAVARYLDEADGTWALE